MGEVALLVGGFGGCSRPHTNRRCQCAEGRAVWCFVLSLHIPLMVRSSSCMTGSTDRGDGMAAC
jgi:hypothetical protein